MNPFTVAVRNVRKSFRDYGIYFLTVMLGVALFYIFNSINSQNIMVDLGRDELMKMVGVGRMMDTLSYFVVTILAFLILYANSFLIRRRKKEMGLYTILGMKKRKISSILMWETFLVGTLSLAVGLAIGVFLSQGMALLTAKIFGLSITRFAFSFSVDALYKSVKYFGITFLVVTAFNVINLNRQKLPELLYADKKTTQMVKLPLWASVTLFILSAGMLAAAYCLITGAGMNGFFEEARRWALEASILLGIAGTFLFFFALSGFFLKLISGIKRIYWKNLNAFTLKQINSKIHTTWISMSFVCLMLFLSLTTFSLGTSMSIAIRAYDVDETAAAVGVTYITTYIGIVFLISCASVLAVSQLSEASDNQTRYALLFKLGASSKMLASSVFKQNLIYFAAPLILAIVHAFVAVNVLSSMVNALATLNIFAMCVITGGVVVLIYGGYFLTTYRNARKTALREF
ncbi:MAG: FtsX-like permease family protein [Oscillospiraceae bacterium]|jgi:putative ABC transport system permease protein|nr:FtsX-like permease family protein [Oscillospiraceae bacterium]